MRVRERVCILHLFFQMNSRITEVLLYKFLYRGILEYIFLFHFSELMPIRWQLILQIKGQINVVLEVML